MEQRTAANSSGENVFDSEKSPQSSQKDRKKYFESDGQIGYKKGQSFIAVTNFYVRCKGYVAKNDKEKKADGFLVEVIPNDTVRSSEEVDGTAAQDMQ
jgi:hypothetical protein